MPASSESPLMKWKDVESKIKQAKKAKKDVSLFLGNGFNISLDINTSYEALFKDLTDNKVILDFMKQEFGDSFMKDVSEKHQYNLEAFFRANHHKSTDININIIRHSFFEAILQKCENTQELKNSIYTFLKSFKNYFSVNYDPLLYKIFMGHAELKKKHHKDGFNKSTRDVKGSYLVWDKDNKWQKNFYLHGALHFYLEDREVRKLKCTSKDLIPTVRASLKKRAHFCIFERNYTEKEGKIDGNKYLKFCLEKLRTLEGVLVIYGWSASEGDKHLIDAIVNSSVEQIYISQHENDESGYENLKKSFEDKNIKVDIKAFNAKTVPFYIKKEDNAPSH